MTALPHIHTCSSVPVIASSSSTYSVVVWLWDLLSWPFEFHVLTHSYGPSPQCHVLGRARSCTEWRVEFCSTKTAILHGRCNKACCGGAASSSSSSLLTFSAKMASVKCFISLLQKRNSLFVLEGQNNAAPQWSGCKRDQLDLILRSCDL